LWWIFLLWILLHFLFLGSGTACLQKTIYSFKKEPCLITCINLNFYEKLYTQITSSNIILQQYWIITKQAQEYHSSGVCNM
jgi:hypothetical protein